MKKVLSTLQGGFSITLDELEYIQNNLKELTSGLGQSLAFNNTSTVIRLTGIDVTITNSGGASPTFSATKGVIWYLDELYLFDSVTNEVLAPGTTESIFNSTYQFDLIQTVNTPVVFKDGFTQDINQVRKTILTNTPTSWSGLTYETTKTPLEQINSVISVDDSTELIAGVISIATEAETLLGAIDNKAVTPLKLQTKLTTQPVWIDATLTADWVLGVNGYCRYRLNVIGQLEISMLNVQWQGTVGQNTPSIIFNLPVSHRPTVGFTSATFEAGITATDTVFIGTGLITLDGDVSMTIGDTSSIMSNIVFARYFIFSMD